MLAWTLIAVSTAWAAPLELTHQGRVLDSLGQPLQGPQTLELALYTSEGATTAAWDDAFTVTVQDGYYSVVLGSGVPLDLDDFAGGEVWVGVGVGAQELLRSRLATVPFAVRAHTAGELVTTPLNARAQAPVSCKAAYDAGARTSGLYWLDPNGGVTADAFVAHCGMELSGGGWTHVMTVHPADGDHVAYFNTQFWEEDQEYGTLVDRFTGDYKGPAAWSVAGNDLLIEIRTGGRDGRLLGWRHWSLAGLRTYASFFTGPANVVQTNGVVAESTAGVYAYEPLIGAPAAFSAHSDDLRSNRFVGPNADQSRLAAASYSPLGDDNQPGLGTNMNSSLSPNGPGGYWASGDVELWVNSTSNLWCTYPGPGTYKLVGTDYGCGTGCVVNPDCDARREPAVPVQTWTYRIFVRE